MTESKQSPAGRVTLTTLSAEETFNLGRLLGRTALAGNVLALIGELGAGKTVLSKGIAAGLGADPNEVTSPTFVLMRIYAGRLRMFHYDAYRMSGSVEMLDIGSDETFYGQGVSVIEWADRVEGALPEDRLDCRIEIGGAEERQFAFAAGGPRATAWLGRIHPLA